MSIRYLSGINVDANTLFVDSANDRVGIGTGSPATALDVNGTISVGGSPIAWFSGNYNRIFRPNGAVGIYLGNDTDQGNYYDNTTHYFRSSGGGTTYAVINNLGNVGIGTTAPEQKLDVRGTLASIGNGITAAVSYADAAVFGSFSNHATAFYTNSAEKMRITAAGNVGIGYTNPAYKLEVNGLAAADRYILNSVPTNSFQGSLTAPFGDSTYNILAGPANGPIIRARWSGGTANRYLEFGQTDNGGNYTANVRIVEGNVGIGTTAPSSKLHVEGDGRFEGNVGIGHGSAAEYFLEIGQGRTGNGFAYIDLIGDATYTDYGLRIIRNNGGSNTPSSINHRGLGTFSLNAEDAAPISFLTSSSERMRITSAGNVGIGTTAPKQKLIVEGTLATKPSGVDAYYSYLRSNWAENNAFELGISEDGASNFHKLITSSDYYFGSTLQFWTSDTEKMRITSAGNVGIGTTAPNTKLRIQESGTNPPLSIQNTNADGYSGAWLYNSAGTLVGHFGWANGSTTPLSDKMYFGSIAAKDVVFTSSDAERMRITSAGNVGIGTTAPDKKLVVVGDGTGTAKIGIAGFSGGNYTGISFNGTLSEGNYNVLSSPTDPTLYINRPSGYGIQFRENNLAQMIIASGGNVAIGTTNSGYGKLGVYDASNALIGIANSTSYAQLQQNGADLYVNVNLSGTAGAGSLVFRRGASSTESMRIDPSGNVGIGTSAPGHKLQVAGGIASTFGSTNGYIALQAGGSTVQGYIEWFKPNPTRVAYMGYNDGVSANNLGLTLENSANFVINGGNVGIGTTSPKDTLAVNGTIAKETTTGFDGVFDNFIKYGFKGDLEGTGQNLNRWIGADASITAGGASANKLKFKVYSGGTTGSPIDVMTLDGAGNVGIGTTSPGATLDVAGNIFLSETGRLQGRGYPYDTTVGSGADASTSFIEAGSTAGYRSRIALAGGSATDPNTIKFLTTSAERMRITSGGNVGIGTTAPSLESGGVGLDILNSSYTQLRVRSSSSSAGIEFKPGSGDRWEIQANTSNQWFVYNRTDGEYRLLIDGSGNVGIGTTSPGAKLEIAGTNSTLALSFGNSVPNNPLFINTYGGWSGIGMDQTTAGLRLVGDSGGNNLVDVGYYSGNVVAHVNWVSRMRVLGNGNVGIGTTTPDQLLHINAGANTAYIRLVGQSRNLYIGQDTTGAVMYSDGNAPMAFFTSGTEKMRITSAGNVGIGTTAPTYKLEIRGAFGTSPGAYISGSTYGMLGVNKEINNASAGIQYYNVGSQKWFTGIYENTDDFGFYSVGTGGFPMVIKYGTGNVGIGTTAPLTKLHVAGQTYMYNGASNALFVETDVADGNTRDAIYLYEDDAQAFGRQAISWYNGNQSYYKARLWTEVGGSYAATTFGIDVADNARNVATRLVIQNGNVGIGTTSPTEKLHVDGNAVLTYNNSYQGINSIGNKAILARVSPTTGIINYAEYATAANLNGFVMGSDDARVKGNIATDSLEFITNGSTRMTVLSSGNVGVNTTTPGTNFHVVGDVLIQTGALGVGVNPNATDGRIDASNDIVAYSSSDRRLKENITPIANALDKVKSLTGVEFDWKPEHKKAHGYEGHDTGVIAQEVQEVMPTAVRTNDTGYLAVRYEKLIGLLIEANKELAARVEELEKKLK